MKKIEQVYREILYQVIEKKNSTLTQKELSQKLKISLSTVNHALQVLRKMNSIQVNPMNFKVINVEKILSYWACIRNIKKDIIYQTRINKPIRDIEQNMPPDIIFAAYSAYKFKFKDIPADYSEVYIYSDDLREIKKRFLESKQIPNLFILKKDENIDKYGKLATTANIFVDLWNIKEWYAKDFLNAIEKRIKD